MIFLMYAFKTILISGLLCGYYWIFLRNKVFHRYNRIYLLSLVIISLLLPLLRINLPGLTQAAGANAAIRLLRVTSGSWEEAVTVTPNQGLIDRFVSGGNFIWFIYLCGALILLVGFVRSLLYIRVISRRYQYEKIHDIRFFQTTEQGAPFSFFKRVFWSRGLELESNQGQRIFRHELFHVQQFHSFDIVLLESITVLCWFNPFIYLIKKEVKAIHEFLADEWAASGINRHEYAELLVQQSIQTKFPTLIHPFFQNHLKRRIIMITQWQNIRNHYGSRLMVLPVLLVLFCVFAFRVKNKLAIHKAEKNITVIIDAGHGGADAGAIGTNGSKEKEISLRLATKISELSKEYNVNVVLTRDKDELAGGSADLRQSLEYRAGLAAHSGADLFLSIHVNADTKNASANGFEFYISDKPTPLQSKSIALGSILAGTIKKDYEVAGELKQRSQGVYVLKEATVPAVLIECGYITNDRDEAFIRETKNQEKIARDILEGVVEYQKKIEQHTISLTTVPISDLAVETNTETALLFDADSVPFKQDPGNNIYKKVEVEAEYPGGGTEWSKYLNTHLHYPDKAQWKEVQGDVIVQFIVGADGAISDVKAISGPELLRAEAVRVIKESGTWTPARNGDLLVKSYKRQPIRYRLEVQTATR